MKVDLLPEHQWLQQLVGDWTSETECSPAPGQPPEKVKGTEKVRSLGGAWVVCEGTSPMPVDNMETVMSLGYDPAKKKFVGSFIGSMMAFQWLYEGELDAAKKKLALGAKGPSFTDVTKSCNYIDTIEIVDKDTRTLSSQFQGENGKWVPFMTVTYRRAK